MDHLADSRVTTDEPANNGKLLRTGAANFFIRHSRAQSHSVIHRSESQNLAILSHASSSRLYAVA